MIKTKDDLKYYLRCDAAARGETKSHLWKFQVLYRKAEYHYNNRQSLWHKLAYIVTYARFKYRRDKLCSELPLNVFAEGLVIWHGQNIIVNENARVGRNFSISSGCCIGSAHDGVPVIGDNVEMTIGSRVLGGITIADDVTIGAGALVLKSIDTPYTTWGGLPAKCISTKENTYVAEKKARLEGILR
jgi:serine O-acetyltransferase